MLRKVTVFLFAAFVLVLIGCGGGGGGGGGTTPPPPPSGLQGIVVQFFDGSSNLVGQATTDSTGSFSATIPTEARFFQLQASSINLTTHYRMYLYGGAWYSAPEPTCKTPLPTLTDGSSITLPGGDIRVPPQGSPPPFPSGCGAPAIGSGSGGTATVSGRVITGS